MHCIKFYYFFRSTPACFNVSAVILMGCTKVFNAGRIDVLHLLYIYIYVIYFNPASIKYFGTPP
jgi:hypothetical protein